MGKRLLSIFALTVLVASTLVGCSGASPTPSTLTILSITDGTVLVMKAGTDSWTEAQAGMSIETGDSIKTGDSSGAEITFFDGSTIELEAGTQIEITSLDTSSDTGAKTITLMQTIGTTISRVTKLLDPASSYQVETPTGVAAVRGSVLVVRILEDGTTWIINEKGNIWAIAQGVEIQVPEGRTYVIRPGQLPELVPLNRPPVATGDSVVTDADSPVIVDAPGVLSNDSDPDVGDTLTVTAVDTSATLGALTWSADGSFTYDPNGQFEYLPAGNSTSDSFTYTVSDGNGGTDTATVTVIIKGVYEPPPYYPPVYYPPVNYPPVAVDDSAITSQNTSVTIDVLGNDSDPNGDTLTVASVTPGTNGSVTNNGNSVTYIPALDFRGIDSFTYTVSDGKGGTDTATVTVAVTVTNINYPPVAVDDSATTPQDTPVTIDVLGNDSDPDGDILALDSVGPASNGSSTSNGSSVTYTPAPNFTGTDSFTYTISDGNGGTDTGTVTITVVETPATFATIRITVDEGPTAPIYVQDTTTGKMVVDGNVAAPATIEVVGGHSYCVWVGGNVTRYVNAPPSWSGDGTKTACGVAEAGGNYPAHFTQH